MTSPSTRRPPEKLTFPSMRVPAPIRLSIRFCGLLGCLRNIFTPLRNNRVLGGPGIARSAFHHAYLDRLHFHFGRDPERAFDAVEILEGKLECRAAGIGRIWHKNHITLAIALHLDNELQRAGKGTIPLAALEHQQAVAVLAGQYVTVHLETQDADLVAAALGGNKGLEKRQVFAQAIVLVLELLDLARKLALRRLLDL